MRHQWANGHPYNQVKLVALYVTISAMKSCYLRTDNCLSWKHVCNGLYLLATQGDEIPFCLRNLSGLPMTLITLWLNPYSIMKVISFSPTFVERISGFIDNFVFNYNCPTMAKIGPKQRIHDICTTEKIYVNILVLVT